MQTRRGFGEGASPALYGDAIVLNWDQEVGSFIVCLDANTGDERWRNPRDEVSTWATPRIVEHDGLVQVIVNAANRTRSYNLENGDIVWECGGQAANPIASPVVRNGVVYCMTGFRGYALYAIPLSARGDITDSDTILWRRTDAGPYVSSPLLYDNQLYFTKGSEGILCAVNAETGEPLYSPKRLGDLGTVYASPVGAAGRVYITDREGTTLVIEHGPEFKELAVNKIDETVNASPAIVDNQLLLRGDKHLYCIAEQ
jgi:outer membrane protein assembly factor BamB